MNRNNRKFLIAGLLIFGSISYLVYAGIKETSVFYLTVSEALSSPVMKTGQDFRMEGSVLDGTINRDADSLGAEFTITDDEKEIPVRYKGSIPDMFADGIDVVVQGRFNNISAKFEAHTLLTSCPSKYEASEMEKEK
jgi:cytochrome c-type biogenesis protein CcmE